MDTLALVLSLARFQKAPIAYSDRVLKQVLQYLHEISNHGLFYHSGSPNFNYYVNAYSFRGLIDRKLIPRYVVQFKQATTSMELNSKLCSRFVNYKT